MPNQKAPLAKARLTGADKANPQRYRDRKEPATSGQPVGDAPAYMDREAKAAWRELAKALGWLAREDRHAVEVAALAIGQVRTMSKAGEPVTAALVSASRQALAALGATPADRSKIHVTDDDEANDPFAKFGMQ